MKSVRMCFLIFLFVLLEVMCCQGCWTEEREALLNLPSGFYPFSWKVQTDCCEWEGVYCNSSTGRVTGLLLYSQLYINYSDFSVFKDLKELYLSSSHIVCVGDAELPNLQLLSLTNNYLDNATTILSCLDGLPSLKSLYLIETRLNTSSLNHVFESMSRKLRSNLEVLDISWNHLTNEILPSLEGFTSLKELYLAETELDSDLHFDGLWSTLRNVEVLVLSGNNFKHTDIGYALSGLSSLKSLYLRYSKLTWRSIYNISKLSSLENLDLGGNHLNEYKSILRPLKGNGKFESPTDLQVLSGNNSFNNIFVSSLRDLPHLQYLDLSQNQFEGILDISGLSTLTSLVNLDLSYNNIHTLVARQGSRSLTRLNVLNLNGNTIDGNKLRESLRALSSSIRKLSLAYNNFITTMVAGGFHDLKNLEDLRLDSSKNMQNEFFKSIGNLTSLKILSLSNCDIEGTLPQTDWFKLKNLEELDLHGNLFVGSLPTSFLNMTSLRKLELSQNQFSEKFDSNIASFTSLEYFGFKQNQFEVPISFTPFFNHSNLKFIYGEGNKVILDLQPNLQIWIPKFQLQVLSLPSITKNDSLPLPKFLLHQKNLTKIDFAGCRLEGVFPYWLLENNTKLTEFYVRNCSFIGTMKLPLRPLLYLHSIDISDNNIIGEIPSKNISSIFPNLQYLNISGNHIKGSISPELGRMELLYKLDLSRNELSGEILKEIFGAQHQLNLLKLSNNKLEGPIFTIPTHLELLSLNDNYFSGTLPSNIFNMSIISLDVSNNHLVGKIPSLLKKSSTLLELRMSNNHFEGSIPSDLTQHEYLSDIDISQNNLSGIVPSFLNSSIRFIHLSNNHFTGLSKKMFKKNSYLVMLDLSHNEISSNIQDMIQDLSYTKLNFLLLKGNHITGDIPKELCWLINLTILDLLDNKFSGGIPHCLGKMAFDNNNLDPSLKVFAGTLSRGNSSFKQEHASFTSKKRFDTYMGSILAYMSGIDLSQNKLKGNIPYELGNLKGIKALNLSHNDLTGQIPYSFSNLVQIESLDISFNKLSGQIPPKLNILTSLEVLSVAHNNFSGPIPEGTNQFATFDESSYEGNPFLCGPPLPKSCHPTSTIIQSNLDTTRDNDGLVDIYIFCVSFIVSYTLALLATAIALYINPYWRQAWFYYIELVTLHSYYFIVDHFCRFYTRHM